MLTKIGTEIKLALDASAYKRYSKIYADAIKNPSSRYNPASTFDKAISKGLATSMVVPISLLMAARMHRVYQNHLKKHSPEVYDPKDSYYTVHKKMWKHHRKFLVANKLLEAGLDYALFRPSYHTLLKTYMA